MSIEPLVTVRMSAHNHARYVERAIESIVGQTYRNIELVVIDDGSTDGTPAILARLSRRHGFVLEMQSNRGLAATYNRIQEEYTRGKYVKGCASDDELTPDAVKRQVAYMEAHPEIGGCYGKAYTIDQDSRIIGTRVWAQASGWLYDDLASGGIAIPTQTLMYRKDVLDAVGPYDESIVTEDKFMLLRVARFYPLGFVDAFLYRHRKHETNISGNHRLMYENSKRVAEMQSLSDPRLIRLQMRRLQPYWFFLLSTEDRREALKYFWPTVRSREWKYFVGGSLNLLGLSKAVQLYRHVRQLVFGTVRGR